MDEVHRNLREYHLALKKGSIQKAYREILGFLSELKAYLKRKYPSHHVSGLYQGYMDMSYFSFTPEKLKEKNLKIALIYLHEENRFEAWLSGVNKASAADFLERVKNVDTKGYAMEASPEGVDYITTMVLMEKPDFSLKQHLMEEMERKCIAFSEDMMELVLRAESSGSKLKQEK